MVLSGGSSTARLHGVDRFYNPPAIRRQLQLQQQQQQQQQQPPPPQPASRPKPKPAQPPPTPSPPPATAADNRVESDDSSSKPSVSSSSSPVWSPSPSPRPPKPGGNLERFLEATTPSVPALYDSKTSARGRRNGEVPELEPYFNLGDLWDTFSEWSAYGAGVPLVLNESDFVVQYYVPYLSAIQIYVDSSRPVLRLRQAGEESDRDTYQDSSSESSSENEGERAARRSRECPVGQEGFSSDDGELCNHIKQATFQYLASDTPYGREPLADKILFLSRESPNLKTYKSCDLLPSSWMSVAWYPIYRIPTGPTLKDLETCFLTFHSLATPSKSVRNGHYEIPCSSGIRNIDLPRMLRLPIFGLASYKLRTSIWNNGSQEQQLASTLLQTAEEWIRLRQVDHPDFRFFTSRYDTTYT